MDAKPQRPLRAIRQTDENAIPIVAGLGKAVHQRHKSTPVLSNLMQVGAIKSLATKRAAFADVSNQRTTQVVDVNGKGKAVLPQVAEVPVKDGALSRRPQRAATLKASTALHPVQPAAPIALPEAIIKPAQAVDDSSKLQVNQTRSIFPKRSTSILRNNPQPSVDSILAEHEQQQQQRTKSASSAVLVSQPEGHDPIHVGLPQPASHNASSHHALPRADPYVPQVSAFPDTHEQAQQALQAVLLSEQARQQPTVPTVENHISSTTTASIPLRSQVHYEQDYDSVASYGEDYTSRRSLGMLSDTTGGATVVLAPKYTSRILAEIAAAKELVEACRTPEEIEDDHWDTTMVAEYGDEIFDYMRVLEDRMRPNPHYMDHQTECQWSMRAVLLDWLVQVHARFTLLPETLFLSVNYIDRFLSTKVVSLAKLQLVGATALFLAAKYEEVNCPSISEIVYMVDNGYTVDEILKAERFMLSMLAFELGWPGPMSFLRRISKADDFDLETRTLAKYFLEVTIMDERFLACPPSSTSAAAHCLARQMLRKGDWSPAHVYYSNYTYAQIRPLIAVIVECCENPMQHHAAVYQKYQDKRYKKASIFVQQEMQNGFLLPPMAPELPHPRLSEFGLLESITQGWRGLN